MKLKNYNLMQIRFIHSLAKHMGIDDENAVSFWIKMGLAAKFNELYWNKN
jgi:hypothetical protein